MRHFQKDDQRSLSPQGIQHNTTDSNFQPLHKDPTLGPQKAPSELFPGTCVDIICLFSDVCVCGGAELKVREIDLISSLYSNTRYNEIRSTIIFYLDLQNKYSILITFHIQKSSEQMSNVVKTTGPYF